MAPYTPTSTGTSTSIFYTVNTVGCTALIVTQRALFLALPRDPIDVEKEPEERYNHRQANRADFRHASSDRRHREKWRYHRQAVRHGKAELKREKARNKLRPHHARSS